MFTVCRRSEWPINTAPVEIGRGRSFNLIKILHPSLPYITARATVPPARHGVAVSGRLKSAIFDHNVAISQKRCQTFRDMLSALYRMMLFPIILSDRNYSNHHPILANFAICYRPSVCLSVVCLSSVTFVRPTQAVQIFGNISTALGTLAIH